MPVSSTLLRAWTLAFARWPQEGASTTVLSIMVGISAGSRALSITCAALTLECEQKWRGEVAELGEEGGAPG